jgi:hypothetical protein
MPALFLSFAKSFCTYLDRRDRSLSTFRPGPSMMALNFPLPHHPYQHRAVLTPAFRQMELFGLTTEAWTWHEKALGVVAFLALDFFVTTG